jgi:hypothetical protein
MKPLATIGGHDSAEMPQKSVVEREARFAIVESIRAAQGNFPAEEVEQDVTAAVRKVRKTNFKSKESKP